EDFDVTDAALQFISPAQDVFTADDALAGARDILAERAAEDADARADLRGFFAREGRWRSRVVPGKEAAGQKFRDYFEWDGPLAKAPSHRVLALRRGEKEGILSLSISVDDEAAVARLEKRFVTADTPAAAHVRQAVGEGYRRLLKPSLETEARLQTKRRADEEAIRVFVENLRQLLLASPLGQRRVLAIDPGFRTGGKVVCLDAQGKLLHHTVIYPDRRAEAAEATLRTLCKEHKIEAIAVGNGTAGRETEAFVRHLTLPGRPLTVMVNESGASVYSASESARAEFPDLDLTVRGAVSIGRRLMDPLAELVKIEPKAIGVGQYQHDVDQQALKQSLDDTVVSCVNAVGVELNTAGRELLTYVSGVGPQLAANLVAHRNEHGPFRRRADLLGVARFGPKAFEQAAGFLRIREGAHPLDAGGVHPERYELVERMAADLNTDVDTLLKDADLRRKIDPKRYVTDEVGLPTLRDILDELAKPGRDPREAFQVFQYAEGVTRVEDLKVGMRLPGLVTNVTAFGAFVDVGVHQDGLVHVSRMADRYVSDPNEVVSVNQVVEVTVVEVDAAQKRITLSMKSPDAPAVKKPSKTRKQATPKGKHPKANPPGGKTPDPQKAARPPRREESMEDKLAALRAKFGK
ncbi:MAG: helix-hairpin-helix domain-containing protein, partial [Catalinimonas sp.]